MWSVSFTADEPMEGSACKVLELHGAHASLRVVFLYFRILTMAKFIANQMCILVFLHHHMLTYLNVSTMTLILPKNYLIALFLPSFFF